MFQKNKRPGGEMVDTSDLKSGGYNPYRFDSVPGYIYRCSSVVERQNHNLRQS